MISCFLDAFITILLFEERILPLIRFIKFWIGFTFMTLSICTLTRLRISTWCLTFPWLSSSFIPTVLPSRSLLSSFLRRSLRFFFHPSLYLPPCFFFFFFSPYVSLLFVIVFCSNLLWSDRCPMLWKSTKTSSLRLRTHSLHASNLSKDQLWLRSFFRHWSESSLRLTSARFDFASFGLLFIPRNLVCSRSISNC